MKIIVRELVDLRMWRRKSHGQFCILFNHIVLSGGLVLAGYHCVLGGVVHIDLSEHLLRNMQNYIPKNAFV
jgi:hypothetical protein